MLAVFFLFGFFRLHVEFETTFKVVLGFLVEFLAEYLLFGLPFSIYTGVLLAFLETLLCCLLANLSNLFHFVMLYCGIVVHFCFSMLMRGV